MSVERVEAVLAQMPVGELRHVVRAILDILYSDGTAWVPENTWSPDTLDDIAFVLSVHRLTPRAD